ncbi:tRNA dimethylallyltransferase [Candidatus Profftella armatura]
MLYFKALRDGINKLPPANLKLRTKFNIDINKYGISFLYDKLKLLDPVTANRLNPQDKQRIQRALEVIEITGKPISFFLIKIMCYKNYLIAYY